MACIYFYRPHPKSTLVFGFLLLFAVAKAQIITTIAGTGVAGFSGDGGSSVTAQLYSPVALCLDAAGNIYFTDYGNQRIRKIDGVTGIITTIAGNGTTGFSGDGGPALNAQLNNPFRICLDKSNNLYFSDYNNLRVRKVNLATGIITTIAGNGTQNYINGGLAVNSGMLPAGLAFDAAGNLFISQHPGPFVTYTSNIISKIDMATGVITTVAGTGVLGFSGDGGPAINAQLAYPNGLSFDQAGNLYIADQLNNRVRKINMSTGIITTVAGDGGQTYNLPDGTIATNFSFKNLADVFVNADGDLITSDNNNLTIDKVNIAAGTISRLAGTGYYGMGQDCVDPRTVILGACASAVTDQAGNLYFTDVSFHRIRKVINATVLTPQIQISSATNAICSGTPVTFNATVKDAGSNPFYQWTVNGANAGTNNPIFTSSVLKNNDAVICMITSVSNISCVPDKTVSSNTVLVKVNPLINPSVIITSSADKICSGTPVTFNATAKDAGSNPFYQWMVNGVNTGTNTNSYTSSSFIDNDNVTCLLVVDPNDPCIIKDRALSNTITMDVTSIGAPAVVISASDNKICPGDRVFFTAIAQNAGSNPSYQWMLNGMNVGDGNALYENENLQNGDSVYCLLTAVNSNCPSTATALSNVEKISVNPIPGINLLFSDTAVAPGQQIQLITSITGDLRSFSWTPSHLLINAALQSPTTVPMTQTTTFQLTAVSNDDCVAKKEIIVYVFYKLYMPSAFTPNGDGRNDVFRIPNGVSIVLKEFSIFNRWGNKVFTTTDIKKGWNGTYKGHASDSGTYIYTITGSTINGKIFSKGTVTLVR